MTDFAAQEAALIVALAAIPEIAAAGFHATGPGLDGGGVALMRRRSLRGRWHAVAEGFAWVQANATDVGRLAPTIEEAVRETLLMVLHSLLVARRRPTVPMTAEAVLRNPVNRIA